jgi:hypothetical protein
MLDDGRDTLIDLICRLVGISVIGSEIVGYVLSFTLIAGVLIYEAHKRKKARDERRRSDSVQANQSKLSTAQRCYDAQAIGEDAG